VVLLIHCDDELYHDPGLATGDIGVKPSLVIWRKLPPCADHVEINGIFCSPFNGNHLLLKKLDCGPFFFKKGKKKGGKKKKKKAENSRCENHG